MCARSGWAWPNNLPTVTLQQDSTGRHLLTKPIPPNLTSSPIRPSETLLNSPRGLPHALSLIVDLRFQKTEKAQPAQERWQPGPRSPEPPALLGWVCGSNDDFHCHHHYMDADDSYSWSGSPVQSNIKLSFYLQSGRLSLFL